MKNLNRFLLGEEFAGIQIQEEVSDIKKVTVKA